VTPTAQDLVTAWVDGYVEAYDQPPHRRLIQRVAGQAKALAKECASVEEWRQAWQASRRAGLAGKAYLDDFLVPEVQRPGQQSAASMYLRLAKRPDDDRKELG
jgi:hypothetical protein